MTIDSFYQTSDKHFHRRALWSHRREVKKTFMDMKGQVIKRNEWITLGMNQERCVKGLESYLSSDASRQQEQREATVYNEIS